MKGYTWWVSDWRGSETIRRLTMAQQGVYRAVIDLLMLSPKPGFALNSDGHSMTIAEIAEWVNVNPRVVRDEDVVADIQTLFSLGALRLDDGVVWNERAVREGERMAKYQESQRRKGLASAEARKATPVQPRFNPGSTPVGSEVNRGSISVATEIQLPVPVPVPVPEPAHAVEQPSPTDSCKPRLAAVRSEEAREVFRVWAAIWRNRPKWGVTPEGTRADEKRLTRIKARLAEGHSASELMRVAAGWYFDSWDERRKMANSEVLVLYRDAAQVEKGLALYRANQPRADQLLRSVGYEVAA